MADTDPFATQRGVAGTVSAELEDVGFEDPQEVGRGGFGVVYRCTQPSLDRVVAVKVLTADLDEDNRARFLREQRAAGRLTGHPNIVNILQAGITANGRPFIVMPFESQGSLETRIRRQGPLPLEDVLRIGVKMAGALEAAHAVGIIHRDVKPANILFTDYGEPALTDFGIAHVAGEFQTAVGVLTGSPAFTAPEVFNGAPPSTAADVYGLGATLFAAATGHAAFERRSGEQVVAQFVRIATEPVPDPRDHGVAADVSALIGAAMAGDPNDRPSVVELGDRLREAQRSHGFSVDDMTASAGAGVPAYASSTAGEATRPPTARTGRTRDLPLELTSFVDRREELAKAKNLLATARLVTLVGVGGVGKTRLALRIAHQMRVAFADGVFLVELAELQDESLLVDVVAGAIGLRDQSTTPLKVVLENYLAKREVLLVLDNCEHLIDAVAHLAESLLRAGPGLRILATSRERIGIGGEVVLPLAPLPVPDLENLPARGHRNDAMTLFVERAAAAVPGFVAGDDDAVTIAKICRRLEGLPLSIELAAAGLRAISPEQVLQRLTDRYALLTRGSRDAPERQQTLRMCVDWSYELCTPLEQRMWARLSVFVGGFELDAAEHICGSEFSAEDVFDAVSNLVDKSILIREQSGPVARFRMLETIREYGQEKASEAGDLADLRRAYREWYEQLARDAEADWIGPRQLDWMKRLTTELANIRQALDFCASDDPEAGVRMAGALFPYWFSRSLIGECGRWCHRMLEQAVAKPSVDRAKAAFVESAMAGLQGDSKASAVVMRNERALAEGTTDPLLLAYLDLGDAYGTLFSGDLQRTCEWFEGALSTFTDLNDVLYQVVPRIGMGLAYEIVGRTDLAISCYERALEITEARGESVHRSYAQWALAVVVWRQGDRDRAEQLLQQSLLIARKYTPRLNISLVLQVLSWIAMADRNAERAVVLAAAADHLSQSIGSPSVVVPGLAENHEMTLRAARDALSSRAFEAARRKGEALGVTGAVAYALGEDSGGSESKSPLASAPTKRELEVAGLVAEGLTNREIAERLTISLRTAQGHVERLLGKLGFTRRSQIAVWFTEQRDSGE
ncbi:protein kinase [Rhodococcus sp. HM1]|uniref:protein kinase domain-containing protein n=1 Tax=Rhodococcus sp. HM1 TaxID=2937759 RepID=UPI00200B70ED|nr:protein kinase [Rhodococcus sp. HM1]MCK8675240.1 protein kinase [Rhodococcus sp. HM1]